MFWPFMAVRQRAAAIASAIFILPSIAMKACRMTTGLRTSSGIGHSSRVVGAIMLSCSSFKSSRFQIASPHPRAVVPQSENSQPAAGCFPFSRGHLACAVT